MINTFTACLDLHKCLYYASLNVKLIIDLGLLQIFKTIYTIKSFSGFPTTELIFKQLLLSFSILHCLRVFNVWRNIPTVTGLQRIWLFLRLIKHVERQHPHCPSSTALARNCRSCLPGIFSYPCLCGINVMASSS